MSYERKHNEANGENNRDGADYNFSCNCGVEGNTDDPHVTALRLRMQKNHIATLFLSIGVPMLLGGDEFGRTQQGNNNAYCHDNEISWFDWSLLEPYGELHRFCKEMIAFRKANPALLRADFFRGREPQRPTETADLIWFDATDGEIDWSSGQTSLACRIHPMENRDVGLCLMFNSSDREVSFRVPSGRWFYRINTAQHSPDDIVPLAQAGSGATDSVSVVAKSLVVLTSVPRYRSD